MKEIIRILGVVLFLSVLIMPSYGKENKTLYTKYQFQIAGKPIDRGTLWLYYYGWGYLERYRLGDIKNGRTRISLTPSRVLADTLAAHSSAFFVALHVPTVAWYKTDDFDYLDAVLSHIDKLGRIRLLRGVRVIDLPKPVKQTLHVQNGDGSPRAGEKFHIETYISETNHCGVNMSFGYNDADDEHDVITDSNGEAEFYAPLNDLYLDHGFYEWTDNSAGRRLTYMPAIILNKGLVHNIRQIFDEAPKRSFMIQVMKADGTPAYPAQLLGGFAGKFNGSVCGGPMPVLGKASPNGELLSTFAPEHIEDLWIVEDENNQADRIELTTAEKFTLFSTGKLIVRWPQAKP